MDRGLVSALGTLGLDIADGQLESLQKYLTEIELWNPVYKLIAADHEGIIYRHIIDSLAPLPILLELLSSHQVSAAADLGSGNGMPGIPLSILLPELPLTLVERSGRRVGFLRNALAASGLSKRVSILEADITEVTGTFDLLLFRAFRPLPEIFGVLDGLLAPGGAMFAYKGQLDHARKELGEVDPALLEGYQVDFRPYAVPRLDAQRTICMLSKGI